MPQTSTKTVTLQTPIPFGKDKTLDSITIRKPSAGELRGTKLARVSEIDVDEFLKVLPRISSPVVSEGQLAHLDCADLMELANEFADFFTRKTVGDGVTPKS